MTRERHRARGRLRALEPLEIVSPNPTVVDTLRLSVTDRCDMRCRYCMPRGGVRRASHDEVLRHEEYVTVARRLRERFGLRAVRITGGEPLTRRGVVSLVASLASLGLDDLAMTTNGQALARYAGPLAEAGLDRVNLSLDSLRPDRFARITGGSLRRVLQGLDAAVAAGLTPLKLNTVVLRGVNDDEVVELVELAADRGCEIRFLELMALGEAVETHARRFVTSDEVRARLEAAGVSMLPAPSRRGAPARRWRVTLPDGRVASVGFISPESEPFCSGCRRLRLTARGTLLGCLMHETGPDLRPSLRAPSGPKMDALDAAVLEALRLKPACRVSASSRQMSAVGG